MRPHDGLSVADLSSWVRTVARDESLYLQVWARNDNGEAEMGDTFVCLDVPKADFVVACGPGTNEGRTA